VGKGHEHFLNFRKCHSLRILGHDMARWKIDTDMPLIHLAVEGSVGGTSLGLHVAADTIADSGRVLWVSEEMPDNTRFSQLFNHLSLTDASRFHAMSFSSSFDKAIDAIIRALDSLPSIKLIVLDDWCPRSGQIPSLNVNQVSRISEKLLPGVLLLLISKSTIDASGERSGSVFARAENKMRDNGFSIWTLSRPKDGPLRNLSRDGELNELKLDKNGFENLD
jgi:hypothetical protein